MKGRRYVWSDPRIQELAREFIPAADECGYLQSRPARGPEAELFQKIAEQGHYAGRTTPTATRQGTYAAAPGGRLLASVNTNDPDEMARMLRKAMERWKTLPREERLLATAPAARPAGRARLEDQYPEGGLVLQQFSRDLPRAAGQADDWRGQAWNIDFAWFTKEEARSLVPAKPEAGARLTAPDRLIRRLVQRHLLDNVRGQTSSFQAEHVQKAEMTTIVERTEGDLVHLRLEGATRAVHKGKWELRGWREAPKETERGYAAELRGRATFHLKEGRFVAFDLLAVGPRWGGTTYNMRADDLAPQPLGIAFRLAPTSKGADRVAPAHAWDYFR